MSKLNPASQDELRRFYDVAFSQAWRYLSRLTGGNRPLTEDLIQEVMCTVANNLAKGTTPSGDTGWILTVARNHFLDHVGPRVRTVELVSVLRTRRRRQGYL